MTVYVRIEETPSPCAVRVTGDVHDPAAWESKPVADADSARATLRGHGIETTFDQAVFEGTVGNARQYSSQPDLDPERLELAWAAL